jgi:hypothetical protein
VQVILRPEEADLLGFSVDAYLDNARRAQDAFVPYLQRSLRLHLKRSLSDVIKQLRKHQDLLPAPIAAHLLEYWDESGGRLRDYRDLQHFTKRTSDARIYFPHSGEPAFYFQLPNNPECKSPGDLRFGNPDVHAVIYVWNSFESLLRVSAGLMRLLTPPSETGECELELAFVFQSPVTNQALYGNRILNPLGLEERLRSLAHTLYEEAL